MSTRREFITLLGGAAAAWPVAAWAQQREQMRRIGVLAGQERHLPEFDAFANSFGNSPMSRAKTLS